MNKVILHAGSLDGYLTPDDLTVLRSLDSLYRRVLGAAGNEQIDLYAQMGAVMQNYTASVPKIHVYPFESARENHSEASRIVAKLRDVRTATPEFIYYTQRAFELLFKLAYCNNPDEDLRNHLFVKTPVTFPAQNYAVHRIVDVDEKIGNTVMCVLLRGALLPSMIVSKEIQEYSSTGYITPFALFKISRNDTKNEKDMEYIFNLDKSYFDLAAMDGKDLVFADPMNATGGSIITIVNYLLEKNIHPKSIKIFNEIAAIKGALRIIRSIPEICDLYTLWLDPALNEKAYIMPGLGDAGDRLNGRDDTHPKNLIRLISGYGSNIASLYNSQVRTIEDIVMN